MDKKMSYIEAFDIIENFREMLKCAVEHDLYVDLDTETCQALLDALDTVDY